MVQKYQSPVRVYKQPFELVMAVSVAFPRRFSSVLARKRPALPSGPVVQLFLNHRHSDRLFISSFLPVCVVHGCFPSTAVAWTDWKLLYLNFLLWVCCLLRSSCVGFPPQRSC